MACALMTLSGCAASTSSNDSDIKLTIELTDGSLILGTSSNDTLSFHSTAMGDFKMTWAEITSLEYPPAGSTGLAKLVAANGDVYEVQLESPTISVVTKFGQKDLPAKLIRSIRVVAANPDTVSESSMTGETKLQLTIELVDGSSVVGQPPAEPLVFHSGTLGDVKIPWSTIGTIKFDDDETHLTAANGDVIAGRLTIDTLHVETSFGKIDVPVKMIRSIGVSRAGSTTAHLIGWWKLDDGTGTVAKDSSPGSSTHDGTFVNNPQWVQVPGQAGTCLHFDGNQYVSLGNILQDGYPEISIACWEKAEGSGYLGVMAMRGTWDQTDGIGLAVENDALFGHWIFNPVATVTARSRTFVQDDQWHHLVGTLVQNSSGNTYRIYVDGQLKGTTNTTVGFTSSRNGWIIGWQPGGGYGFRGLLKDLRIYDCALSLSQVRAIYAEQPSLISSAPSSSSASVLPPTGG